MRVEFAELQLPRFVGPDSDPRVFAALALYNTPLFKEDRYPGPPSQGINTRLINDFVVDRRRAFVARDEDGLACAVACYDSNYRLSKTALLARLIVAEDMRKYGVGRFMIDNLADVTRQQGLEALRVQSLKEAIGFYATLGFVTDEIASVKSDLPYMSLDVRGGAPAAPVCELRQKTTF